MIELPKVGDRVTVVKPNDWFYRTTGVVVMSWQSSGVVEVNFGNGHRYQQYYLHELDLCEGSGRKDMNTESVPPASGIPILLWCPECGARHIDSGVWETKPHHTHACQKCGHVWRPAIQNTTGVQFLPGFKNDG